MGIVLLAVVQGLTEFLPVSSSGHLVLTQEAIGWTEPALFVDVALHVGTLLAVVLVYRESLVAITRDALRGRLREIGLLFVGSLPAGVVGVVWKDAIEGAFESAATAACGLLGTAAILLTADAARVRRKRRAVGSTETPAAPRPEPRRIGMLEALCIGAGQALAILPGVSRSGTTISVGLMLGVEAAEAARFSFLLSIPAIGGAAVLSLAGGEHTAGSTGPGTVLLAMAVAGLVGWVALRFLLAVLNRGAFRWFGLYCAVVGAGYLLLFW